MNIDNYKMDQTDELYNRITFDVLMDPWFKVVIEETDTGARSWQRTKKVISIALLILQNLGLTLTITNLMIIFTVRFKWFTTLTINQEAN